MAAKSGGESRALIITLVFFVLLAIGLTVTTYYGFADRDQLTEAKKTAEKERDLQNDRSEYYRYLWLQSLVYDGIPLQNAADAQKFHESDTFSTSRTAYDGGTMAYLKKGGEAELANNKARLTALDASRRWNPAQKRALNTFQAEIAQLKQNEADRTAELATQQQATNAALALKKKAEDDLKAARTRHDGELQALTAKFEADLKAAADRKVEIATLGTKLDNTARLQAEITKRDGLLQEKQKEVLGLKKELDDLVKARGDRNLALFNEEPKGEISSIEGRGERVLLSLRSTNKLPAGQTFSIRARGLDGKPVKEIKGSLRVTEVLTDRLVRAEVTDVVDRGRDPLMRGDFVFTVGWDPNYRQRVALVGVMDPTGEGGDWLKRDPGEAQRRVLDFKRELERQGMIVDAYLDLKDSKLVGEIKYETDFLIRGEIPEFDRKKDPDPKALAPLELMNKTEKEALQKGVTVIALRKFLSMNGYRAPRQSGSEEPGRYSTETTTPSAVAPGDKKQPAPAPAPAGK